MVSPAALHPYSTLGATCINNCPPDFWQAMLSVFCVALGIISNMVFTLLCDSLMMVVGGHLDGESGTLLDSKDKSPAGAN